MYPTLRDGDVVTVDRTAYEHTIPAVGELVLARHPFKSGVLMVKRVHAVTDDGRIELRGDLPSESEDSRGFGALSPDRILGRIVDTPSRTAPQPRDGTREVES